ncbi:phosphatase PAP2 family protein [Chryseobacterium shigense]|uniref:Phosphatidic acid phosphatase type 2/haloperoxidase domain-containing protein n=1 Tax=Chryseobacterium shigense TaxID=297244 RepID=A0A841N9N3_9FLAO|nr:phosphatase PAP2 family protein [Chryseobacterium shigense]MBB6370100.1 hypothetical protein [Chryseobacterium shigense]
MTAQNDTVKIHGNVQDSVISPNVQKSRLNYKSLIIPAAFIGYGVASLTVKDLKQLNFSTRDEINEHRPDHIKLDNFTQYAPAVLVYGLNAAGIKGKHNFRDRTVIYVTSQAISAAITLPLKHLVKEERPDESNNLSFPSGHTAAAFSSAQFMFREYKDTNFWLSLSGYPIAVFTGVYRMLNDKHWVGDVVAGAGFGILSTELAYWLFPKINTMLGGKNKNASTMIMPFYQEKSLGIGLVKSF